MAEILTLRAETNDDADFLFRLYASTREEEMKMVPWSAEQKDAFLRMQFQAQTTHYHHYFVDASFMVISYEGRAAGRLCVHRGQQEIRVVDIALLPEYRNVGIATTLLKDILSEAESSGRSVGMHVLRNSPALRLYERLGFQVTHDEGVYLYVEKYSSVQANEVVGRSTEVEMGQAG